MLNLQRSLAVLFTLSSLPAVFSLPNHDARHDHGPIQRRLPSGTWYQPDTHPVHALFKRGTTNDGLTYAAVGSPEWAAGYPEAKPDPTKLPQEWVDALNAAIKAGTVPNLAPSTQTNGGNPTYGSLDPMGDEVCSTTYKCRKNNDTWDAPDGTFGVSFDDGPLPTSDKLYDFLKQNSLRATHFFIGVNILNNPAEFTRAFAELNDDIAVHTWTHPYMTTLTNEQLLGEFGWTMQIIHNSTGGRLPKYWRPPYGDSDNRVSAIAREVFGLQTVIWNQDTEDWSIGEQGGATSDGVHQSLTKWLTGPKSPGLIILEHELSNDTVQAFIDAFPLIGSNGWKTQSVAELDGGSAYWNTNGDDSTVTPEADILAYGAGAASAPPPASGGNANSTSPAPPSSPGGVKTGGTSPSSASNQSGNSSTSSSGPTGAAQKSSASSLSVLAADVPAIFAAVFTLLVSSVALA